MSGIDRRCRGRWEDGAAEEARGGEEERADPDAKPNSSAEPEVPGSDNEESVG